MTYLLYALLMFSGLVYGGQGSDCSQIENAAERLACFDQQFPESITPHPKTETEVMDAPASVSTQLPSAPSPTKTSTDTLPQKPKGVFSKPDAVHITARVKAIRSRDKQKMVFLLDNEQVWLQVSPRNLPIREGDEVSIKSGTIGGFILRTDSGTSTRVRRIK